MYSVNITCSSGYVFDVEEKGYKIRLAAKGGEANSPSGTLLAALGSCIGVYVRKYAEGAKLDLGEFEVGVKAEFCKERPISFRDIDITIDIKGAQLDERRKAALVNFVKNCPVHNTLKVNPKVNIALK